MKRLKSKIFEEQKDGSLVIITDERLRILVNAHVMLNKDYYLDLLKGSENKKTFTSREAEKYLGVSRTTLFRFRREGLIQEMNPGKRPLRYQKEDLMNVYKKKGESND
ncbi:helix-turn-helix domain-containing protein [Parabacteroides sp. PF5-6]|uniref:helix-turn-helix domain-containing protein n=1 Tax=Parabacteroides sp. PF5-6 TaxID=1742403 RepID=UPI002406FC4C|nr:helix-turn-helix domain-containing protein [Parabacteroides sp. PF5-6]MDF9831788.1 hypothetical protein [Parabacteroides sp. PF5-6]